VKGELSEDDREEEEAGAEIVPRSPESVLELELNVEASGIARPVTLAPAKAPAAPSVKLAKSRTLRVSKVLGRRLWRR
jgi:hypothetical protein